MIQGYRSAYAWADPIRRKIGEYDRPTEWTVLHDPLPIGGLAGASFCTDEHRHNLSAGAYTPGSVLQRADGRRYRVEKRTNRAKTMLILREVSNE